MPTREDLIRALGQLDTTTFEDVVSAAFQNRQDPSEAAQAMPLPQEDAEAFARWLAHRHMATDAAIERVVYLPTNAPRDEIRLLEINRFLNPPDPDVIEPLDFTPDVDAIPFKVFVADVTTDQWERIKQQSSPTLPAGWMLEGNQIYSRS